MRLHGELAQGQQDGEKIEKISSSPRIGYKVHGAIADCRGVSVF